MQTKTNLDPTTATRKVYDRSEQPNPDAKMVNTDHDPTFYFTCNKGMCKHPR